jgi:TonB family protein
MTKARIEAMASAQQQQPSPQRETQVSETRAKLAQLEAELARAKTARVPTTRILKSISISGLPDSARDELAARLPVHIGDALTEDLIRAARDAVAQYDSHLRFKFQVAPAGETYIEIAAPAASLEPIIRVGGNVQSAKLRRQPRPVYPPEAKAERVQGAVHLMAIIAADGTVKKLEVIDGHPLLVQSALEAVRQWEYEPTYLNGEPVEVQTQIDVNYTLAQ